MVAFLLELIRSWITVLNGSIWDQNAQLDNAYSSLKLHKQSTDKF